MNLPTIPRALDLSPKMGTLSLGSKTLNIKAQDFILTKKKTTIWSSGFQMTLVVLPSALE